VVTARVAITALLLALAAVPGAAQAAPPPRLAFVGLHGGAFERLQALAPAAGVACEYVADDVIARGEADFARFDAVVLQHLRDPKQLAAALLAAKHRRPELRVLALGNAQSLGPHGAAALVATDAKASACYRAPGTANLTALLRRLRALCTNERDDSPDPQPLDLGVLRRPGRELPFAGRDELFADAAARGVDVERAPRVAVAVHGTHFLLQQPRVAGALIEALDRRGALAFVAIDGGEGIDGYAYEKAMLQVKPDAVIHTCHSTEKVQFRDALGALHLHSLFFRSQSIEQWRQSAAGLASSEVVFQVATQELLGAIEPIATCGTLRGGGSEEDFTPIPERVERLVGRTLAHVRLRRLQNADKKVAIVYYDREASRASLMRGSPTGMMLNAPQSLLAVLRAMREQGYRVDVPAGEDELVALAERSGRVAGVSGPGEAEALADSGLVPVIPVADYERWLAARVPAAARAQLEARWGPPPGRICVVQRNGTPCLVVPMIRLGNVVLMPQPLRGEAYDPSQTHDAQVPPPHSYLGAYLWLEQAFGAHALVHFGTHGSEAWLPGKAVGLQSTDWPDLLVGDLPNVQPWVLNNLGESLLVKRRTYAVLVDHLVPPTAEAGLADGLAALHRDLHRLSRLEPGVLREKLRAAVTAQCKREGLDRDLDLPSPDGALLTDEQLDQVCAHLHVIEEDLTPTALHHLGEAPADAARLPWLVHCGGQALLDALGAVPGIGAFDGDHGRARGRALAEEVLRRHLRDGLDLGSALCACGADAGYTPAGKLVDAFAELAGIDQGLQRTSDEIGNLLHALAGGFVTPGPGQSPERNPKSVPTGRNMFLLDPREIPTAEAWDVGRALADELLQQHRAATGDWPTKVAFNLRGTGSFRDFGVMESQVLWLLGCEPVRDARGNVVDVALVPAERLQRPRIDVFVQAGSRYQEMLGDRAKLLDRAVRLAAAADEPDNRVRAATLARTTELAAAGVPAERAAVLAKARLFGTPEGGGNASWSYLVQRSGDWNDRAQLAEAWIAQERHAYTEGAWGEEADAAFRSALRDSEYVLRSWADTTRGPTTDQYMWKHGGRARVRDRERQRRQGAALRTERPARHGSRDPRRRRARAAHRPAGARAESQVDRGHDEGGLRRRRPAAGDHRERIRLAGDAQRRGARRDVRAPRGRLRARLAEAGPARVLREEESVGAAGHRREPARGRAQGAVARARGDARGAREHAARVARRARRGRRLHVGRQRRARGVRRSPRTRCRRRRERRERCRRRQRRGRRGSPACAGASARCVPPTRRRCDDAAGDDSAGAHRAGERARARHRDAARTVRCAGTRSAARRRAGRRRRVRTAGTRLPAAHRSPAMNTLETLLHEATTLLLPPVVAVLVVLLGYVLLATGGLLRERIGRRALAPFAAATGDRAAALAALLARADWPGMFGRAMRHAGADPRPPALDAALARCEVEASAAVARLQLVARAGPTLGLMATLIPMGPALLALADADVGGLARSLVVAFTATVVGLLVGLLATTVGSVRRHWYAADLAALDALLPASIAVTTDAAAAAPPAQEHS
jgi:cobaltochelatase CobN